MQNIKFTVEQVEFEGWTLWISAVVKGKYDSRVHNPKVTVIFDSGTQTRRVPLAVQSYTERNGDFMIYAQYHYEVHDIFFNEPLGQKISVTFEVMYGDDTYQNVPFVLGDVAKNQYGELTGKGFEGMEGISSRHYNILFESENGKIDLCARFSAKKPSIAKKVIKKIKGVVAVIWRLILLLISICLLPVFIIDGLLTVIGILPREEKINTRKKIKYFIKHLRFRMVRFCKIRLGILPAKLAIIHVVNRFAARCKIKDNRIVFLSNRRTDLSGNFEFVYRLLKNDKNLDIRFVLDDRDVRHMSFKNMLAIGYYLANAKVILVDDYMELLFKLPRRKGNTLIQLWHACGAFKTFGCSRMGKKGGQNLKSPNHRNYDYATVSSDEIRKFYAEGFGLPIEKVVATGVPRTDIFFDKAYKEKVTKEFYEKYPKLKDKKILLFAPTFRGNGKNSGYYPTELFDVNALYEALGEEYAIIVKHHPFVHNRNTIDPKYQDYIIDLSTNSELNDLLFITDLLVTDYSSVVFEASLLEIPMLFYGFDLEQYIATRGFYYEFETFVPGKIVYHFDELIEAVKKGDFESEKIAPFRDRFFDGKDGKSSQRTVDLIYKSLKKPN